MAYVRLDGMGVSTAAYPSIDAAPSGRVGPLAATFHIGVARCVSVMQDGQRPPTVAEQTAEARQFLDDARRLRKAVRCCLADTLGSKTTLLGRWTPQGPLGGCAGGFWPVTVRVS